MRAGVWRVRARCVPVLVAVATIGLGACASKAPDVSHADAPTATTTPGPTAAPAGRPTTTSVESVAPRQRQVYERSLPMAIQEAGAAVVRGRLYVVGGYDSARNSSVAVFVFDGSMWVRGPSLPIALNHPGVAALGDDLYVAGGFTPSGATNRAFVLVAGSDSWHEITPLQRPRGALALLALSGRLYAIGGRDRAAQIAVPEVYDPATAGWHDLPSMPGPRNHVAGFVDGADACVAGGRTPDTSSAIDCFDPTNASWRSRGALPTGTSGAAAAVVDGITIVAGGEPASETHLVGVVQTLAHGAWTETP